MLLISLALIGLIAITIITESESSTAKQAESIPIRVSDKQN